MINNKTARARKMDWAMSDRFFVRLLAKNMLWIRKKKLNANKRTNRNAELSLANAISKWIDGPLWICSSQTHAKCNRTYIESLLGICVESKFKIYFQIVVKSICSVCIHCIHTHSPFVFDVILFHAHKTHGAVVFLAMFCITITIRLFIWLPEKNDSWKEFP